MYTILRILTAWTNHFDSFISVLTQKPLLSSCHPSTSYYLFVVRRKNIFRSPQSGDYFACCPSEGFVVDANKINIICKCQRHSKQLLAFSAAEWAFLATYKTPNLLKTSFRIERLEGLLLNFNKAVLILS